MNLSKETNEYLSIKYFLTNDIIPNEIRMIVKREKMLKKVSFVLDWRRKAGIRGVYFTYT